MLGKIFAVLVIISFVFSSISGNMTALGDAVIKGADEAVRLSASMLGVICLWSGIMRVLDKAGLTMAITRLISPLLKLIYPKAYQKKIAINDIAADYSANLLGLGNAALPLGIKAMKSLKSQGLPCAETANDEMITFAVLNTVPIQLIPTSLIALRNTFGSQNPSEIILPVWICSVITFICGVIICKLFSKVKI